MNMCDDIRLDGEKLKKHADLHISSKNSKEKQISMLEDIRKLVYDIYDAQQIILEKLENLEKNS